MVSLMMKVAAVIASLALAALLGPQVFSFRESSDHTTNISATETDAVPVQDISIPTPEIIIRWVLEQIGSIQIMSEQFVLNYLKNMFPNASPVLGRFVIALIILAVAYWKAEWLAVSLRAIIMILIAIIGLAIALALMGLLG